MLEHEQEQVMAAVNEVYSARERCLKDHVYEQDLTAVSLSKGYTDALFSDIETDVKLLDFKVYMIGIVAIFQSAIILWILGR